MKFSGTKLREIRETKGMTQKALAEKIGARRQQVAYWELNANSPTANTLGTLATALEVAIDDLFERDGEAA